MITPFIIEWSDTEIIVKVPYGEEIVDVIVSKDFEDSNSVQFTFEKPIIDYIDPIYAHPDLENPLNKPSKWELEAVNANVISPYLALDIGGVLSLKFTYSLGFYDKKVHRQGAYDTFHSNFNFITNVFYTFRSTGRSKASAGGGKISKDEALNRASQEVVKLVKSGNLEQSWVVVEPETAEKKKFATGKQWIIHFYNDEIEDDEKCDLYIFLSSEGQFKAYNHFGE